MNKLSDGRVEIDTSLNDGGVKAGLTKLGGTLKSATGAAIKGTVTAIAGVSAAIVGVGVSAVKYNATMEQYATSFEVMTGSADKASDVMERLKKIGAETPFEFEDLAGATQTLMAFGFTADEAIDQFKILGDISQGDSEKLNSFAGALGKMQSSGKVTLEALNIMIEQGFNPLQVISQKTGESMSDLYDRVSKGTVSLDEIKGAMVDATSAGGQFYQSMDKQSQTLNGRISTLKDNFSSFTGIIFGGATSSAGGVIDFASNVLTELQTAFEEGGVEGLATTLGSVLSEALTMGIEQLPDLAGIATTLITNFLGSMTDAMYEIDFGTIISTMLELISTTAVSFMFFGISIMDNVLNGIQQALPNIIDGIGFVVDNMIEMIAVFLPGFLESGLSIVLKLAEGLTQAIPELIPRVVDIILNLAMFILDNIDVIIDAGINLLIGLAEGLINALPILIEKAPEIISGLVGAIISAAPKLVDAAFEIITKLGKGLIDNIPLLISKVPELISSLVKKFDDLNDAWLEVGENIIQGIWKGISGGWDWLVGKVKDVADSLFGAAKDALGIHSPSKKFEWIGEMSGEGVSVGFTKSDPIGSINDVLVGGFRNINASGFINSNALQSNGGIVSAIANSSVDYDSIGNSVADALIKSNLSVKIGNRELGRIVKEVSYA